MCSVAQRLALFNQLTFIAFVATVERLTHFAISKFTLLTGAPTEKRYSQRQSDHCNGSLRACASEVVHKYNLIKCHRIYDLSLPLGKYICLYPRTRRRPPHASLSHSIYNKHSPHEYHKYRRCCCAVGPSFTTPSSHHTTHTPMRSVCVVVDPQRRRCERRKKGVLMLMMRWYGFAKTKIKT